MSDEPWIIRIPESKAIEIANIAKDNIGNVINHDKSILNGISDFPTNFIQDKIESVSFSTSACDNNGNVTVCIGVNRKDNGNIDTDPIGILFTNLETPTLSAGYIRHGNWHEDRTITQDEAKKYYEIIENCNRMKLNEAPKKYEEMHKRINAFLFSKTEQSKSKISRIRKA